MVTLLWSFERFIAPIVTTTCHIYWP